ncbi:NF-kappa-B inhibitor cactus-like isoform X2 [Phymastichus coffea]|uniref:NF-kappa-B inhibitor cactus-like isoform X2 n=1 Tax=Phymastichus coffea TaxID=108790 RepID=UPI00273C41DC|nr:NF-kappa-B inhibitor cactus-like isoform X2 [Phymastichus coffea]
MSNQRHSSENAPVKECDSGFVSCTINMRDNCSTRVAQLPESMDQPMDLEDDLAEASNVDQAQLDDSRTVIASPNVSWTTSARNSEVQPPQQSPLSTKPVQYFAQNGDGDTQLHLSVYGGYTDLALWLIDNAPHSTLLDIKNDDCLTALHIAAMSKQASVIRRLVLVGADITITTPKYHPCTSPGNAAIHMACEMDDLDSVRALTEPLTQQEQSWLAASDRLPPVLGRDLELRNYDGVNPMHMAIKKGNLQIVRHLVKVGAEVNTYDPRSGLTSFHLAIENHRRDIVEYLAIEHSSCLNVPTRSGTSSFEICYNVDKQLADDLVRWGAAPIVRESESDCSDSESDSDSDQSIEILLDYMSVSDVDRYTKNQCVRV